MLNTPHPPLAAGGTPTGASATDASNHRTPSLRRRMAAFLYEGVLLFGVLMISAYLWGALTQQRHALQGRHGLQAFLFLVLGIYFVWFWARSGQTLAQKTWHIQLVGPRGSPVTQTRALARYLCCWVWFLPALGLSHLMAWPGSFSHYAALLGWVLLYALSSYAHPNRQFLHDAVCGTRLVDSRPEAAAKNDLSVV